MIFSRPIPSPHLHPVLEKSGIRLKPFDESLARRFPESRWKVCPLVSIHEHLPRQERGKLKEVEWTEGLELAKGARRDEQEFDCATCPHQPRSTPKDL